MYTVPLSAVNVLSRLTKLTSYDEQRSRHGRFDSKIFESVNYFRIESNLEASQVPTTNLLRINFSAKQSGYVRKVKSELV